MSKINIIFAIRSLSIGGAERQFIELVKGINKRKFNVLVCSMSTGILDTEISGIESINLKCFNKKGRYDIRSYYKYIQTIKKFKPHIIYSFLSDLNLISFICSKISSSKSKLVWGIRGSIPDQNLYGAFAKMIFNFQKFISSEIDLIIFNSYVAEKKHRLAGFHPKCSAVIQNGIDSKRFFNNHFLRENFRLKYGLKSTDIAIGITSRIDPIKGYVEFCTAAANLLKKYPNVAFFSIGYGDNDIQKKCEHILSGSNQTRFYWLGKHLKPEYFMPGWDIYCSASLPGEGFPNAIAEAMLCELAPVVTDSGDSKMIVSEVGLVANCGDAADLESKLEEMIRNHHLKDIGLKSRERILKFFSIDKMVDATEEDLIKIAVR
ncbi:MAG: glycosyltransferase [Bacteroidota bacterium]|nr:glycosyltransferase [Bacteroidota bacterium]